MCSILAVIAVFYISITLAFDFVATRPVAVYNCLDSNGYTHSETSCTKAAIPGPISLVPASKTDPSFAPLEIEQNPANFAEASFEGYCLFEKDQSRHGFSDAGTMEMHYVQKNMQWPTRVLWPMWTGMADLRRSQFAPIPILCNQKDSKILVRCNGRTPIPGQRINNGRKPNSMPPHDVDNHQDRDPRSETLHLQRAKAKASPKDQPKSFLSLDRLQRNRLLLWIHLG